MSATAQEECYSISAGCSHLARRLSGPALACMRECAHLMKAEQPRDLGYMQLAIIEVTNCQIASQLLKYFSGVQPFVRKLSCKRPLDYEQRLPRALFHAEAPTRSRSQPSCATRSYHFFYRLAPLRKILGEGH